MTKTTAPAIAADLAREEAFAALKGCTLSPEGRARFLKARAADVAGTPNLAALEAVGAAVFPTLTSVGGDAVDFAEVSRAGLMMMLAAAFEAGRKAGAK